VSMGPPPPMVADAVSASPTQTSVFVPGHHKRRSLGGIAKDVRSFVFAWDGARQLRPKNARKGSDATTDSFGST